MEEVTKMDSILTSVKNLIGGIAEDDESFDDQIIPHINTVLADLIQLGVGPSDGFIIEDKCSTWTDFLPYEKLVKLIGIETYVGMRVQLIFDPPNSSAVIESMQRQIDKFEWRLNVAAETF